MNKNFIRIIFMSVLVTCLYFINIDGVKAVDNNSGNGYAVCYYTWYENTVETGYEADLNGKSVTYGSHFRPYKFGVAAYKATDNNFYAWGELGCGEGTNPWTTKTTANCEIGDRTYLFNQFVTVGLPNFITNSYSRVKNGSINPKWVCPSQIYYSYHSETDDIQYIYFTKEQCDKARSDDSLLKECKTASLSGRTVKQTSKSNQPGELKVNNYKIKKSDTEYESTTDREAKETSEKIKNDIDPSKVVSNDTGTTETKDTSESYDCNLISPKIMDFLSNLFLVIQVLGIVLLVVMSMVEFTKALTASDDDGLKGAIKNTYRRIIIAVLLLLLPMFVIWILNIVNANAYQTDENGKRIIGEDGNPLCK